MTTTTSRAEPRGPVSETRPDVGDVRAVTERLVALLPLIRGNREAIEQGRRLPPDVARALRETGMFALGVPRAIGGGEATPPDLMRLIEVVAAADGSAGWCAMIGLGNSLIAGYMPEDGAREAFADPAAPVAGLAAPAGSAVRVEGGVRVAGRWSFASGITHCDWVWAGCMVMENGQPRMTPHGPEILHVCLPVREVTIHDTWFVSGLSGTGSHDFSVTDAFVPSRRTFALLDPAGHRREPLYRMPPLPEFVVLVGCVGLGIARGALDEFLELAQSKVPTLYRDPLADKAVVHVDLARAEADLASARALLYSAVEEAWQVVLEGGEPAGRLIAMMRMAATRAAETGASVTRTIGRLAGGSAIYASSPLQRHLRDADAVSHHFTVAPHTWEEAGRVLLGRPPIAPAF